MTALNPFKGQRRRRVAVVAVFIIVLVLFFGYETRFSTEADAALNAVWRKPVEHGPAGDVEKVLDEAAGSDNNGRPSPNPGFDATPKFDDPSKPPPVVSPFDPTAFRPGSGLNTGTGPDDCMKFESWLSTRPGPFSEGKRKFPYVRPPKHCRTFALPELEAVIAEMRGKIKDPDLFRLFENSYPITLDTMIKWRGYGNSSPNLATDTNASATTEKDDGNGDDKEEELAYIITGDIDAMWLRDSASQLLSYLPLLTPSTDPNSLASLFRGTINAHARALSISPYCHAFQPPPESGIPPTPNGARTRNHPVPGYDPAVVFDCKWELDSIASFLQLSAAYYSRTGDAAFFFRRGSPRPPGGNLGEVPTGLGRGNFQFLRALRSAVDAAAAMRTGTYDEDGRVLTSAWTFTGWTDRGSETLTNNGLGNPVRENGMVRSAFRPSDDATIFQLLTPANMMFARYLEDVAGIVERVGHLGVTDEEEVELDGVGADRLAGDMRALAQGIREGIRRDAVLEHRKYGEIFAYEVDGFGSANMMDDANVPSLLAMPLWNASRELAHLGTGGPSTTPNDRGSAVKELKGKSQRVGRDVKERDTKQDYDRIYRNTRAFVLSADNPYFAKGPVLSAVGGPHIGPGKGWPMAAIVAGLTAYEDGVVVGGANESEKDVARRRHEEVKTQLRMILDSTAGTGIVHETVNAWSETEWTRPWFGWANGLFGELILRIAEEEKRTGVTGEESLLERSWQ